MSAHLVATDLGGGAEPAYRGWMKHGCLPVRIREALCCVGVLLLAGGCDESAQGAAGSGGVGADGAGGTAGEAASSGGGPGTGAGGMGAGGTGAGGTGAGGGSTGGAGGGTNCEFDTVLGIRDLDFGEGNSGEWKGFGFDLDGKTSTGISTDLCLPNAGGSPQVAYPDGDLGIDNSFGRNLLPVFLSLYPTFTTDVQSNIDAGAFTSLLEPLCLPPSGDVPVLDTKFFAGTPLGTPPLWDGTDSWPVNPEFLADPLDSESSDVLFVGGSVVGSSYDAGTGTFVLLIPIQTQTSSTELRLTLHAARVTMTLSADRKSATSGKLGGVLDTEEFVSEVKKVGFLLGICQSSLLDSLLTSIRQASDILNDGSQDPTQTCNGISIGLAFEMGAANIGAVGPAPPASMACP